MLEKPRMTRSHVRDLELNSRRAENRGNMGHWHRWSVYFRFFSFCLPVADLPFHVYCFSASGLKSGELFVSKGNVCQPWINKRFPELKRFCKATGIRVILKRSPFSCKKVVRFILWFHCNERSTGCAQRLSWSLDRVESLVLKSRQYCPRQILQITTEYRASATLCLASVWQLFRVLYSVLPMLAFQGTTGPLIQSYVEQQLSGLQLIESHG